MRSSPVVSLVLLCVLVGATPRSGRAQRTDAPARVSTQEPTPPFPYRVEDVAIDSRPGVRLSASLALPDGRGPFPAVVLVSGSGPHDRNGGGGAWKPLLVIADHLARHGIASIRYDKRGVALSTGSYATSTTLDFADDAEGAVRFLATHPAIDPQRIGMLGHSEGGMIAPMVAVRSASVAFAVLMAAPGLPGDVVMLRQVEIRVTASGDDPESDPDLRENRRLYAALRAARDSADAASRLEVAATQLVAITPDSVRSAARLRLDRKRAILLTPYWRFFAGYDPRPTLRQLRTPVLVMTGTLDVQVPPRENLAEIASALSAANNRDVTIVAIPGLNHLFQTAVGVAPADYGTIDEIVAPPALEILTKWILSHVQR